MKRISKILLLILFVNLLLVSLALPAMAYSVDISSYDTFRNATYGNAYDIDGYYGAQCWDGAALLWQQLGCWLDTGDGRARGTWLNCRDANAGTNFELIYGIENVKRGDVVVFDYNANFNAVDEYGTPYGHIAFADNDYTPGIGFNVYGQNQLGVGAFSVQYNVHTDGFLGAFRLKSWNSQPAMGTLDINGILDGVQSSSLGVYGTCDVYINDVLVADDVSDFYQAYPVKTKYLIKDIKPKDGFAYEGFQTNDLLGGTIGRAGVSLNFTFSTRSLPKTFKATIVSLDGKCVARGTSNLTYDDGFSAYLVEKAPGRSMYQDWIFEAQDDGSYIIGRANMDWENDKPLLQTGIEDHIRVYSATNGNFINYPQLRWYIKQWSGHYYIENAHLGYCLTAEPQEDASYNYVLKGKKFAHNNNQLFDFEMHNNDILPTDFYISPRIGFLQVGERMKLEAVIMPYDASESLKGYTMAVSSYYLVPQNGLTIDASGYATANKPGVYPIGISSNSRYYRNLAGAYIIVPSLPGSVRRIEEEAYANTDLDVAIIPNGCKYIGKRAFAECASLGEVYIPESVNYIAEDAFENVNTDVMRIFVYKGSEAESYARRKGIMFTTLG